MMWSATSKLTFSHANDAKPRSANTRGGITTEAEKVRSAGKVQRFKRLTRA
jgi:hypothetical protein